MTRRATPRRLPRNLPAPFEPTPSPVPVLP
jgi:hypothetical protein